MQPLTRVIIDTDPVQPKEPNLSSNEKLTTPIGG